MNALDRMGYGGLLLDTETHVLAVNTRAVILLRDQTSAVCDHEDLASCQRALAILLRRSTTSRFSLDREAWVSISRPQARPLLLHAVPLCLTALSGLHTVVVLIDLDTIPRPQAEVLQKVFELTPAEGRLAVALGCGKSIEEVARETSVSVGTLRKHLASVFAKTGTHRQGELVALLTRVAILP